MHEDVGKYMEDQVASASPGELIEMLFDRAVRDLGSAMELRSESEDPRSHADAVHLTVHAQRIIGELNSSLNLNEGGELAGSLGRLYEYMQYRLVEALNQGKWEGIEEVSGLLNELHQAWRDMVSEQLEGHSSTRANTSGVLVA